jgi:hypothetical protein
MDAYWTSNFINWYKINYEEGYRLNRNEIEYASRKLPSYSSQEWSKTTVDTKTVYSGMWGMTIISFQNSISNEV